MRHEGRLRRAFSARRCVLRAAQQASLQACTHCWRISSQHSHPAMTSVQLSRHALAPSALSSAAAEECRRSVSRSESSASLVRFHYEVGVVEPHSGALHLIQVCCQVCVEGRGCCKANVCCEAVCCQLQLPKGTQGPKRFSDEEEEVERVTARTIDLPRTVAASPSSHAGLVSFPITARELVAHVAKCCDLCLDSKGAACCKKDCCAVSCCLVNVEVMGVGTPMVANASCCTASCTKTGGSAVAAQQAATASAAYGTQGEGGTCCGSVADRVPAPLPLKKQCSVSACCTQGVVGVPAESSGGRCDGRANDHTRTTRNNTRCADKGVSHRTIDSPDGLAPSVLKCCSGTVKEEEPHASARGGHLTQKPPCSSGKKPCSSAGRCCDSKVDSAAAPAGTRSSAAQVPCGGGAAAKGCCATDTSTTKKTCSNKDACAPVDNSRAVQPVEVRPTNTKCNAVTILFIALSDFSFRVCLRVCVPVLQVELALASTSISLSPPSLLRIEFQVNGMDCASCSKMVEDGVKRLDSVRTATCSVMTGLAEVAYALHDGFDMLSTEQATEQTDAIVQQLVKLIHAMGYQCELLRSSVASSHSNSKASSALLDETPALLVHLALIVGEKEGVGRDTLASTCAMLRLMPGVSSSTSRPHGKSDPSSSLLLIGYQPDVIGARTLLKAVEQHVGQSVSVASSDEAVGGGVEGDLAAVWRTRFLVCLLFTVPLFVIVYLLPAGGSGSSTMRAMHHEILPGLRISSLVGFLLALPVQVYGGWPLFLSAYRAARFGRKLNIDALVALSTTVAFLYSMATTIASMAGQPLLGTFDAFLGDEKEKRLRLLRAVVLCLLSRIVVSFLMQRTCFSRPALWC